MNIESIPLSALHESPFNPRRTFGNAGLQELAADMKLHGVLSPLLVRARAVDLLAKNPDDMFDGYELVFGHRRLRAATIAGLATVPCMIRSMTDTEVKRAQISENLAREDVHPIEEAEGLQALIDAGDTADQLAEQFGKSRSYVYGRLKLLHACPSVRSACLKGEVGSEVALLLSRLRTVKLQEKALGYIKGKFLNLDDGGAKSFRAIRDLLAERFTLDLKSPMFEPDDATLLPSAGACSACPKRVGNAPEYADLMTKADYSYGRKFAGNPDVCTDPDCYDEKKKAHLARSAAKLQMSGKHMVVGAAARAAIGADGQVKGAYIALKEVRKQLDLARLAAKGDSKIVPPLVVTIQDPRTGKTVEAVKRAELVAAGAKDVAPKQDLEAERKKREAEEERQRVRVHAEQNARLNVLRATRTAIQATERSAFDMTLIAKTTFAGVGHWPKQLLADLWETDDIEGKIDTMTPDELMLFMFDCALIDDCHVHWLPGNAPTDLLKVAAYYGIDVAVARGDAPPEETVSTPSTAARAAKGAKGKANKKKGPSVSLGALMRAGSAGAGVDLVGDPIVENQSVEAGSAGDEVKDEPADAGVEREPNTSDLFPGREQ